MFAGKSEAEHPRRGVRSAQLIVELLTLSDDAELAISLRRVLPALLRRNHWLNFVGWRDALWPALDVLCEHGWPGGVCLSNCPWSAAMAYACKPSSEMCTSQCGINLAMARHIGERFAADDVSPQIMPHACDRACVPNAHTHVHLLAADDVACVHVLCQSRFLGERRYVYFNPSHLTFTGERKGLVPHARPAHAAAVQQQPVKVQCGPRQAGSCLR